MLLKAFVIVNLCYKGHLSLPICVTKGHLSLSISLTKGHLSLSVCVTKGHLSLCVTKCVAVNLCYEGHLSMSICYKGHSSLSICGTTNNRHLSLSICVILQRALVTVYLYCKVHLFPFGHKTKNHGAKFKEAHFG